MKDMPQIPYLMWELATDWGILLLRVVVGIVFIVHGLPKPKSARAMTQMMGMPQMAPFFALLGVVETLAGAALILGYWIPYASLVLGIVMLGAIFMKVAKWRVPFTAHDKTGWEFDLVLLAANILIYLSQGGSIGIGI